MLACPVVCVRVSCERPLTSQGYFGECVTVPRNRSSARSPELFVLGFICLCNKVLLILRIHERLYAFPVLSRPVVSVCIKCESFLVNQSHFGWRLCDNGAESIQVFAPRISSRYDSRVVSLKYCLSCTCISQVHL